MKKNRSLGRKIQRAMIALVIGTHRLLSKDVQFKLMAKNGVYAGLVRAQSFAKDKEEGTC